MNKKDAILASALNLLIEKGVHNTPMSAIAKAAGTGMGTIYNYFATKEVLINAIYMKIKHEETQVYGSFKPEAPIKTQFEVYFRSIIDFFIEKKQYFQFMEQLHASPIITHESRIEGMKSMEPVSELLRKGQDLRVIKNIKTDEVIMFLGGAIMAYLRWYFATSEKDERSVSNLTMMVWDAIKE